MQIGDLLKIKLSTDWKLFLITNIPVRSYDDETNITDMLKLELSNIETGRTVKAYWYNNRKDYLIFGTEFFVFKNISI